MLAGIISPLLVLRHKTIFLAIKRNGHYLARGELYNLHAGSPALANPPFMVNVSLEARTWGPQCCCSMLLSSQCSSSPGKPVSQALPVVFVVRNY